MPFSLGQILGGWRRKENNARKPIIARDEISRRGRAVPQYNSDISRNGVKEISDRAIVGATKNKSALAWQTIIAPHISEKGGAPEEARYIFKIAKNANKQVIKQAIEERYGVGVNAVRVINMPPKPRRHGQTLGEKPGFKKALVALKKGQSITEF